MCSYQDLSGCRVVQSGQSIENIRAFPSDAPFSSLPIQQKAECVRNLGAFHVNAFSVITSSDGKSHMALFLCPDWMTESLKQEDNE